MNDSTALKKYLLKEYHQMMGLELYIPYLCPKVSDTPNKTEENETSVMTKEERNIQLEALREKVASCKQCELCETRNHIVFGSGSYDAEVMFIGEAPGRDEDASGEAFVGRAGKKLTEIVEHPRSLGILRKDLFICNILKCWPPNNRNPKAGEIKTCTPYLLEQINLIKPKVICTLGTFASQYILEDKTPITKLRGNVGYFQGIPVVPTFHPSYIIRNPADVTRRKQVWSDMLLIKELLNKAKENQ